MCVIKIKQRDERIDVKKSEHVKCLPRRECD